MSNVDAAPKYGVCELYHDIDKLFYQHVNGRKPPGEGADSPVESDKIGAGMRGSYIHPITKEVIDNGPIYQIDFNEFTPFLNKYDGEREKIIRTHKKLTSKHSLERIAGGVGAGTAVTGLVAYLYYHAKMRALQAQASTTPNLNTAPTHASQASALPSQTSVMQQAA
jgi:hypothetical protein